MEFEHTVHQETYRRVAEYLPDFFEDVFHDEQDGHFYVRYGSTVLEISVDPYGPQEAAVKITSYCVQGTEMAPELLAELLEINHTLPFGAFSAVGGDVFFSHSVLGRELKAAQLLTAVACVADLADEFDDRIAERWGGRTALERIQDTGGRKRRTAGRAADTDASLATSDGSALAH
jgi:hypothetical protein